MKATNIIKTIVGGSNLGRLEYLFLPKLMDSWGGPFNGQKYRRQIFSDLLDKFRFNAIVETGTYHGTTTSLFAGTSLPVYTVEAQSRYFAYSKMRFKNNKNVNIYKSDSRSFLKNLVKDRSVPKSNVFFYLDAHFQEDLPLREEVEIIFSNWKEAIIMIDDFQVPGSNYIFDDYGQGKTLNLEYLNSMLALYNINVFFPAADSSLETGAKSGSVVLCREENVIENISRIDTLKRFLESTAR